MLIVDLLNDRAAVTYGVSPVDMIWSGVPRNRLIIATVDGMIIVNHVLSELEHDYVYVYVYVYMSFFICSP